MKKLTLIDKVFFLKQIRLFESLDFELLLSIADKLAVVNYDPGELIFGLNEEAYRVYFIVQGTIEVRDPPHIPVTHLKAIDFFGEESMFNDKPRGYEALSKTESTLLTLSRSHLLNIISECPSVALGLLSIYTSNINFRSRPVKI